MSALSSCQKPAESIGVREPAITGRFRRITTHQLCLAWWCYSAGHVTRRQLRVWFAAHEMAERRRYTAKDDVPRRRRGDTSTGERKPLYGLPELKALVGGRGSPTADADLAADLRRLSAVGLVQVEDHAIRFATSADQVAVEDLSGFWALFDQIPNRGRTVPVPRRTLRAMAGGFGRAVTGVMIALMIRSLFWHRGTDDYRIDGRTKGSWIAEVFGLSRRAVTDARAHLIGLGWLETIAASQWELNRWGAHDRIHVGWSPSDVAAEQRGEAAGEGNGPATTEFASPPPENQGEFASPSLNSSAFPSERNLKTSNSDPGSGPAGFSKDRQIREKKPEPPKKASLRDIDPAHLRHTPSLVVLFYQAAADGLIADTEAGQLDFFALAERASCRGNNPGGLFRWLLVNRRFDFITLTDEDAAQDRLRALRQGERERRDRRGRGAKPPPPPAESKTDRMVQACLAVAAKHRIADPFVILKNVEPTWTREQWEAAVDASEAARYARLSHSHEAAWDGQ